MHRVNIRDRDGTKTDPSTITETIYDPCNLIVVNDQTMTPAATGEYFYNYTLSSTATFGRYQAKVKATSGGGSISIFADEFFVFPWDAVDDVRQTMGLAGDSKSIDDDDLANVTWNCYLWALKDIYVHYYRETPGGNPATGAGFDGSNTTFQTQHYPLADVNGDGTVTGTSCASDIKVSWKNSNGHLLNGFVSITNAENGEISIYQSNGSSPIPSNNKGVYLDYWVRDYSFDQFLFQQAVVRLACYEISKRFVSSDKVTLADIQKNNPVIVLDPSMYYKEYQRYVKMNRPLIIGGV